MLAPASAPPPEEAPGEIGPYRLIEKIGEGGFGVVYLANQTEPVERQVALKILKPGMDSRQVVNRFEAERQLLARLDHPNIATILDGGMSETGRSFFAMEYVKGLPITQFCQEKNLDIDARLAVFLKICRAVLHAHQKGIIHRDLKPSNVLVTMVDGQPVPKVIDFGIAKAIDQQSSNATMLTTAGQLVGTPEYMSPEQASMTPYDIDIRSDVYSLGAILYELLTGQPPINSEKLRTATHDEIRRMICDTIPTRPIRLANAVGDLEWITMKALEKERERRYETVSAFSADIGRFLKSQPVIARPPSAGYLLRRFAKRNKSAILISAAMLTILVAALGFSIAQAIRATRAQVAAIESEDEMKRQLVEAEYQKHTAELISEYLSKILRTANPDFGESSLTVPQLLDNAERDIPTAFADRPDIQLKLYQTLATTYLGLGLNSQYRETLDRLKPLTLLDMETMIAEKVPHAAYAVTDLAYRNFNIGRVAEADALYRLVREKPIKKDSDSYLEATLGLAKIFRKTDLSASAALFREALDILRTKADNNSRQLISAKYELGWDLVRTEKTEEGLALLREAYLQAQAKPELPEAYWSMSNLVAALDLTDQHPEAYAICLESYHRFRDSIGAGHSNTLGAASQVGNRLIKKDPDETIEFLRENLNAVREELQEDHPGLLRAMYQFAGVLEHSTFVDETARIYRETYQVQKRVMGEWHHETLTTLGKWAQISNEKEALRLISETLAATAQADHFIEPSVHSHLLHTLAGIYLRDGLLHDALAAFRDRHDLLITHFGENDLKTLLARRDLAFVCMKNDQMEEARNLIEPALATLKKLHGENDPATVLTRQYAEMIRQKLAE